MFFGQNENKPTKKLTVHYKSGTEEVFLLGEEGEFSSDDYGYLAIDNGLNDDEVYIREDEIRKLTVTNHSN